MVLGRLALLDGCTRCIYGDTGGLYVGVVLLLCDTKLTLTYKCVTGEALRWCDTKPTLTYTKPALTDVCCLPQSCPTCLPCGTGPLLWRRLTTPSHLSGVGGRSSWTPSPR